MTLTTKAKQALALAIAGSTLLLSGCGVFSKELHTEIPIDSSAETVWSVLTDFEPTGEDSVLFVHREEFGGLLIPLMMPFIEEDTLPGFAYMNVALRDRVEQSE